jgi:hypothetical protein
MALKKWLGLVFVCCSIAAAGASGGPPKYLKKAAKALDENDPVQVAIYQVLDSYPTFEAVLGPSYSDEEQQAFIDFRMALPDIADQGKMARLQSLESLAPMLRHVNIELEGAEAFYSEQNMVHSRNTNQVKLFEWKFAVPPDEAEDKARRLISSVEALLGKDKKWKDISDEILTTVPGEPTSYVMRYTTQRFGKKSWTDFWVMVTYMRNSELGFASLKVTSNDLRLTL